MLASVIEKEEVNAGLGGILTIGSAPPFKSGVASAVVVIDLGAYTMVVGRTEG